MEVLKFDAYKETLNEGRTPKTPVEPFWVMLDENERVPRFINWNEIKRKDNATLWTSDTGNPGEWQETRILGTMHTVDVKIYPGKKKYMAWTGIEHARMNGYINHSIGGDISYLTHFDEKQQKPVRNATYGDVTMSFNAKVNLVSAE